MGKHHVEAIRVRTHVQVVDRRSDTFSRFTDGGVGQTNDVEAVAAAGSRGFDPDGTGMRDTRGIKD